MHKIYVEGYIYSILEKLYNIIYGDIERQAYYIQVLWPVDIVYGLESDNQYYNNQYYEW